MRNVTPAVRLVARPDIDWDAIERYLKEVGGSEWVDRFFQPHPDDEDRVVRGVRAAASDGEALIEFGGRLCYRSWAPGLNPNVTRVRTDSQVYLGNILESKHGSVLEHANYSFVFSNVSRVFTHELVRHRAGAAYSQESMRFVRLTDIPFWFPDWATEDEDLMRRSVTILEAMEDHQHWMAGHFGLDDPGVPFHEKKAKTSFMRRFAPDGVATTILATFNIRSLRWIIQQRTEAGAEEEIRLVFDRVASIMVDECPILFGDFERTPSGEWVPGNRKV